MRECSARSAILLSTYYELHKTWRTRARAVPSGEPLSIGGDRNEARKAAACRTPESLLLALTTKMLTDRPPGHGQLDRLRAVSAHNLSLTALSSQARSTA